MPTVDDILVDSKYFSKLDLNQGYYQLEIDQESKSITTFTTQAGLKRYKRLNVGISCASEIFQSAIENSLHSLPGVLNLSDGILLFDATEEEHNSHLKNVLQSMR